MRQKVMDRWDEVSEVSDEVSCVVDLRGRPQAQREDLRVYDRGAQRKERLSEESGSCKGVWMGKRRMRRKKRSKSKRSWREEIGGQAR